MIRKIINIIKNWFTPKEEMDPHEVMLYPAEPDITIYTDENGKAVKCGTHNRYKKSCPICREVAGIV